MTFNRSRMLSVFLSLCAFLMHYNFNNKSRSICIKIKLHLWLDFIIQIDSSTIDVHFIFEVTINRTHL